MKVLNFGSLNLDYTFQVEHFVRAAETMSAKALSLNAGGKGLNQSIALAKAGASTCHAGCVGAGGAMLVDLLADCGVDTSYIQEVDAVQGNAMIQVDRSGQNCIILYGGSNRMVTPEQVRSVLENFKTGDYLVLQNEINCLAEIVDEAYGRGMVICLNPSPFDDRLEGVDFSKLSWLLVNEVEAAAIAGTEDQDAAFKVIRERYPKLSLVETLGEKGSIGFTNGEICRQAAVAVDAVDTTGAGDTYTGYFISGLIEGRPLSECMERASMAAAIAVTRPGAAASIPSVEEVEAKLRRR